MHCLGYQRENPDVPRGNNLLDRAATEAAKEVLIIVGNHSKHGKCGSAPTRKSQWGARLAGRTHVHG